MGGAAVEPLTGNCPGGVCKIPDAPSLPTLRVDTGIPKAAIWTAVVLLAALLFGGAWVVARKVK